MKRFLVFIIALGFNICYAQTNSTKTVNLISHLSQGQTLKYTVTTTRTDTSNTKAPKTIANKFNFKITVLDSTDSSYRIAYERKINP